MSSESHQDLPQPLEEEAKEELGFRSGMQNLSKLKHLKSIEVLKSTGKIFKSDTKFMVLMVISILPLFVFMVFYEITIPKVMDVVSKFLIPPSFSYLYNLSGNGFEHDELYSERKRFRSILEIFPFYLILLPLLELLSLPVIINVAAKIYAGEMASSSSLEAIIHEEFYKNNSLKGPFITFLWAQFFSTCTLAGLVWTVVSHHLVAQCLFAGDDFVDIMSVGLHAVMFLVLLYKYLERSVLWNMAMVISLLQTEAGPYAMELSAYYGKLYCKRTRFQLMLMVFYCTFVLRLPFLLARMSNYVSVTVIFTAIGFGLVCFGSLVKWVALLLYFYECKAQVLLKNADEDVCKAVKADDLC